jgi:hypothetical protein
MIVAVVVVSSGSVVDVVELDVDVLGALAVGGGRSVTYGPPGPA